MILLINSANCQVAGFAVATVGWILSTICMGLVEWRVWYMDNTSLLPSGLACVGMWKVCIYHRAGNFNRATLCHRYTYHDTYLPVDIRVAQNLLLVASVLGLLGKVSTTFALRNVYVGILRKKATCNAFVASGILNIAAGVCISIAVIWNYYSVMNEEGIAFPPPFCMPFKPDTQEVGSAVTVACLAAFMMLLSGSFFLSYNSPWRANRILKFQKYKIPGCTGFAQRRLPGVCGKYSRMLYQIFPRTHDHGKGFGQKEPTVSFCI